MAFPWSLTEVRELPIRLRKHYTESAIRRVGLKKVTVDIKGKGAQ